ncbi:MAG: hypothetical protein Q7K43_01855, partial [Candidatus Woesearchaeota archaeon]|nr:hypothetical protein [Candidatus Woesearchaeota archaeon]
DGWEEALGFPEIQAYREHIQDKKIAYAIYLKPEAIIEACKHVGITNILSTTYNQIEEKLKIVDPTLHEAIAGMDGGYIDHWMHPQRTAEGKWDVGQGDQQKRVKEEILRMELELIAPQLDTVSSSQQHDQR